MTACGYLILVCWLIVLTTGYGVDEFIYFDILQPSQLAFLYKTLPAKDFGGLFDSKYDRIRLVPSEPLEACSSLKHSYHNQFVLVSRGECSFVTKAYHVQQAGAVGVIIYNDDHTSDQFISMLSDNVLSHMSNGITIPTTFMRGTDGYINNINSLTIIDTNDCNTFINVKYLCLQCSAERQRIVKVLGQLEQDYAIITIPVNVTGTNRLLWNNAPWNLL